MKKLLFLLLFITIASGVDAQKKYMTIDQFYEDIDNLLVKTEILTKDNFSVEELKKTTLKWGESEFGGLKDKISSETQTSVTIVFENELKTNTSNSTIGRYATGLTFDFKDGRVRIQVKDIGKIKVQGQWSVLVPDEKQVSDEPFKKEFKNGSVKGMRLIKANSYLENLNSTLKSYQQYLSNYSNDW